MAQAKLDLVVGVVDDASGPLGKIGNAISGVGKLAGGVALGGIAAMGGGFIAAATSGLRFNSSMENVTAQLNAFTKDGAVSAEILEMIKRRAASTPFAFEDMAKATTSLLPAAKSSGVALEDLVKQAEILGALNPGEGLEGAAFALKEALSGDFLSLVERFNLPKQRLMELKEQGVPAMEAVGIAMQEMGIDASLVTNMAETMSGRWSTFQDTLVGFAGQATGKIFEGLSAGLGDINAKLSDPAVVARMEELATAIGEKLGAAMTWLTSTAIPALITAWTTTSTAVAPVITAFQTLVTWLQTNLPLAITTLSDIWTTTLQPALQSFGDFLTVTVLPAVQNLVTWVRDNLGPVLAGFAASVITIVVPMFTAWVAATWANVTAHIALAAATAAAYLPLIATVAAVGIAVGALYLAWDSNVWGMRDTLTSWWNDHIYPIFDTVRTWIATTLPPLIEDFKVGWGVAWNAIQDATKIAYDWLSGTAWPWFRDTLLPTLKSMMADTAAGWEIAWSAIDTAVSTVYAWISTVAWPWFRDEFMGNLKTGIDEVKQGWEVAWPLISSAVDTVYTFFRDTVLPAIQGFLTDLETGVNTLQGAWDTAFGLMKGYVSDLKTGWDTLKSGVTGAIDAIKGAVDGLKDKLSGIKDAIPDILIPGSPTPFELGLRGIAAAANEVGPALRSAFGMIGSNGVPSIEMATTLSHLMEAAKWGTFGKDAGKALADGVFGGFVGEVERIGHTATDEALHLLTTYLVENGSPVLGQAGETLADDMFGGFVGEVERLGNDTATEASHLLRTYLEENGSPIIGKAAHHAAQAYTDTLRSAFGMIGSHGVPSIEMSTTLSHLMEAAKWGTFGKEAGKQLAGGLIGGVLEELTRMGQAKLLGGIEMIRDYLERHGSPVIGQAGRHAAQTYAEQFRAWLEQNGLGALPGLGSGTGVTTGTPGGNPGGIGGTGGLPSFGTPGSKQPATNTVYSLTINTAAPYEPIAVDFRTLAAQNRRG